MNFYLSWCAYPRHRQDVGLVLSWPGNRGFDAGLSAALSKWWILLWRWRMNFASEFAVVIDRAVVAFLQQYYCPFLSWYCIQLHPWASRGHFCLMLTFSQYCWHAIWCWLPKCGSSGSQQTPCAMADGWWIAAWNHLQVDGVSKVCIQIFRLLYFKLDLGTSLLGIFGCDYSPVLRSNDSVWDPSTVQHFFYVRRHGQGCQVL